jgi:large subunit ribosomal protein L10
MSTRIERTAIIDRLEKEFGEAGGIYLADNNKISVEKITQLRISFRKAGIKYIVVKNSLAQTAAKRAGKDEIIPFFKGPTGVAIAGKESTVPAKIIRDFQKDNKSLLGLKAAYVDGTVLNGEDALRLADIPSREVLLSQLLGCLQAPMSNFVGSLSGIFTKLTGTLSAVKDQKESNN